MGDLLAHQPRRAIWPASQLLWLRARPSAVSSCENCRLSAASRSSSRPSQAVICSSNDLTADWRPEMASVIWPLTDLVASYTRLLRRWATRHVIIYPVMGAALRGPGSA